MRTLNSIVITASLALVLGAGQASALSSINLVYLDGASGGQTNSFTVSAVESDIVRFAITIVVDSLGYTAHAFDLRWDADLEDELDLMSYRMRASLNLVVDPTPPPHTLGVFDLPTNRHAGEQLQWFCG